jgi:acyl-[acyl-carrier-protein]-phospholipid O-acyltransferase/long-chain-fatty-acid--[acyl-carrier-protein] ligase
MTRVLKFLLRGLLRLLYGVKVTGLHHYHAAGRRVLIVANHTSLLDGVLLYAWLPDAPTFAVNTRIARQHRFKPFLKFVDCFIMDPDNPLSIKSMIKYIKLDRKAVIFPEGRITTTGVIMKIYAGPGMVAEKSGAMILPIAIDGAHLSPFSYLRSTGHSRWFPRITLTLLPPERLFINPDVKGHARREAASRAMQQLMFKLHFSTYDYDKTLFAALLESRRRYGNRQVVIEDIQREPLDYNDLILRVFILARLIKTHTSAGEYVGILLPNVCATVITFMALQSLGRVTAMLNFTAGVQAILKSCRVAGIKTVFTSRRFIEGAKLERLTQELEKHLRVIFLEDLRNRITWLDKAASMLGSLRPESHYRVQSGSPDPGSPAVILFTSGSEGVPKGVVLSHRNILANYAQVRCHINFNQKDIVFACLPLFHSFGLNAGCLMPLLGGSKVFIYPSPLHYRVIPELIYELGATILFGTSTFFKGYARYAHIFDFHSLRYAVAGAEKLRDDTRQIWMDKFGIRIYEGYGVTESSPVISVNTPLVYRQDTVGPLVPGMEYYLEPVAGIAHGGKLVVRGPNVMLGYLLLDRPGEIRPPATHRGPGWHDTGDIATVDDDGHIKILGRAKRFAKIAGEMISLTAVEELAMSTWPNFNHAAINLPDDRKGEKIVLVTDNHEATRRQIQETAKSLHFSELYIPRKVVLAEQLPLLSTGKIDYIKLTELALKEDQDNSGWIAKLTHLVKKHELAAEVTAEDNAGDSSAITRED